MNNTVLNLTLKTENKSDFLKVYWNSVKFENDGISISRYLEKNENSIRKKYIAFIHDLGEYKLIRGTNIINHFQFKSGYNVWWMSLLVEKNLVKSRDISDCLKLFAFEELVKKYKPVQIKMITSNYKLLKTLKLFCKNGGIKFNSIYQIHKSNSLKNRIPKIIQGFIYILKSFFDNWSLRLVKKKWNSGKNQIFIFSNFINFDEKYKNNSKVSSTYLGTLPLLFQQKNLKMNFLNNFFVNPKFPNRHNAISQINKINSNSNKHGQNHQFLYSFLDFNIFFKVLIQFVKIQISSTLLLGVFNAFSPKGSDLNFWYLLKNDWGNSTKGTVLSENLILIALIDKVIMKLDEQILGLYLHENSGCERAFIQAWKKYQKAPLIGIQHATIRYWDLRYFEDLRVFTNKSNIPRPDKLAVNGPIAKEILMNYGYLESELVETEALRYLNNYNKTVIKTKKIDTKIKVLLCGDIDFESTNAMLQCVEKALSELKMLSIDKLEITYKSHPINNLDLSKFKIPNLKVTNKSLKKIINSYDLMIAPDSTSAAVEAYQLGLKVILFLYLERVNFSPLKGVKNVSFISTSDELKKLLSSKLILNKKKYLKTFFWSDQNLKRWKTTLMQLGLK